MRIDLPVFLLTRSFRDVGDQLLLTFWGTSAEGPVRVRVNGEEPLFYVPREVTTVAGRREPSGLTDLGGRPVDVVRFPTRRAMQAERQRLSDELLPALESDVKPHDRFLMERFVTGAARIRGEADTRGGYLDVVDPEMTADDFRPALRAVSFDIETDGADGALFSIAVASRDEEHVFVVSTRTIQVVVPFVTATHEQQLTTLALNADTGAKQWVGRWGEGRAHAAGLALAPDGSRLFVTGDSLALEERTHGSWDLVTVAYDTRLGPPAPPPDEEADLGITKTGSPSRGPSSR